MEAGRGDDDVVAVDRDDDNNNDDMLCSGRLVIRESCMHKICFQ